MEYNNYSYARRGFACSPITSALTSNSKFITPCSNVYYQQNTQMLQYPGYSGDFITTAGNEKHPDIIKTYFGKSYDLNTDSNPVPNTPNTTPRQEHPPLPDPIEKSCPNCHLLRHTTG